MRPLIRGSAYAHPGFLFFFVLSIVLFGSCSESPDEVVAPRSGSESKSDGEQVSRRLPPVAQLDVLPDSCPNPVNPKSQSALAVALLGSNELDVNQIDVSSLMLEGIPPLGSNVTDVTSPRPDTVACDCAAEGPDGFDDLILEFDTPSLMQALAPLTVGMYRQVNLSGFLLDGTPLEASDCIIIGGEVTIARETVSTPSPPDGPTLTRVLRVPRYFASGSVNSVGHAVEYRFDRDADGAHDYTDWHPAFVQWAWTVPGTYTVKTQARCTIHKTVVSDFSEGIRVKVNEGPDTDIFQVVNTYFVAGQPFQEIVPIGDGIPDTVPYGSWINVFYNGVRFPEDSTNCFDFDNLCLTYQNNFTRYSSFIPIQATIPWLPHDPKDSNPFGTPDTTSMNVGSWEYTVRARTWDEFDFVDITPAEVEIVGNFDPTLDSFGIENYDGSVAGDGDTISWNWLKPANLDPIFPSLGDTTDFTVDPPQTVKQFSFRIRATGHDHPKDPTGSGVKAWFYLFLQTEAPYQLERFARAGFWSDGMTLNVLDDEVTLEVRYTFPLLDPNASIEAWRNLPDWLRRGYDFSMQGRDTKSTDVFRQYMWVDGIQQLLNVYNTAVVGRRTAEEHMWFYLTVNNGNGAAVADHGSRPRLR